jgi:dephospho-CoA kinase
VHRLYERDEVKRALVERWGESVLTNGAVDRRRVGEIVFADRGELDWLEALLHPLTVEEQRVWREEQTASLVVVEVPLLYETGAEKRFDAVVVITAPRQVRAARTNVLDLDERARRLIPDEEKVKRADFAYVNDGTLDDLDSFVADVISTLISR